MPARHTLDAETLAAIERRAAELADDAPPLSNSQALLLVSLASRYPLTTDDEGGGAS